MILLWQIGIIDSLALLQFCIFSAFYKVLYRTLTLFKDIKEARARSGARVYFRKRNGKIEILAKSNKDPKNQEAVIKILRKKYG